MAVKSHKLGPGSLVLGASGSLTEFEAQCSKISLEPSVDEGDPIPVLSGEELAGDDEESYVLKGEIIQEFSATSLLKWCHEHRGTSQPFVFIPNTDGDLSWTGTVKIRATSVGGDIKKVNTSEFEFKGVGSYEITTLP